MKHPMSEVLGWPRTRWVGAALGVFFVHLILLMWFSERTGPAVRTEVSGHTVRILQSGGSEQWRAMDALVGDPTLFALPSSQGFAGEGWRRASALEPVAEDWRQPVTWLDVDPALLGRRFLEMLPRRELRIEDSVLHHPPQSQLAEVPPLTVMSASQLIPDAGLEARGLVSTPALPSITHSNVVANSVLRVRVSEEGFVGSAVVIQSGGLARADELALRLVRQVRFRRLPASERQEGESFIWGRFTFRWVTVPPRSGESGGEGGS